jgi:hypothetical protein
MVRWEPPPIPPELRHMPIDPKRELPIPYIVERPGGIANFGVLDPRRAHECYEHRLCAMCGLVMGAEVALYGDRVSLKPDGFYIEAPIHERCAEIALGGLCPFISQEDYPRRRMDDPQVAVLGDRAALPAIGRTVAKRPSILAIAHRYQMALMMTDDGSMPVYLASDVIRVRRFAWIDGRASEVGPGAAPGRPATVRRAQPRRLPRSKRRH